MSGIKAEVLVGTGKTLFGAVIFLLGIGLSIWGYPEEAEKLQELGLFFRGYGLSAKFIGKGRIR